MSVRAKKHLGQHFLNDASVCQRISDSIQTKEYETLVEIGPGMGALTEFLRKKEGLDLRLVEVDQESVQWLIHQTQFPAERIVSGDFLRIDLLRTFGDKFGVTGNFPYNISSQILFRVWEYHEHVPEVVGMFQREVAQRIANGPGTKEYGILSVLLQAFYNIEYLFSVPPELFSPPPKVHSGVIRLVRNSREDLPVEKAFFARVVKMAFNQRRKTLRNSLKALIIEKGIDNTDPIFSQRPEQLSVDEFVELSLRFGDKEG